MESYLKVVVSGEVDSGKSSLIGSFLYQMGSVPIDAIGEIDSVCRGLSRDFEFAYLLDSLEEERRGEFTLDTTQAFCKNRFGPDFLFIDVPGHLGLLKNMLCGSSSADTAILVIDAAKRLEPGARRHVHILKFLGVRQVICCVNKMDLVNFDPDFFAGIKEEVALFLGGIGMEVQLFIPVSARGGDNLTRNSPRMPWYKGPVLKSALCRKPLVSTEKGRDFYFPVQYAYDLSGGKKAYLGSAVSGRLRRGESVKCAISGCRADVREIKIFPRSRPEIRAPESAGLVLFPALQVSRGEILYRGQPPQVQDTIAASLFCIRPLVANKELTFRCLTQETRARIIRIDRALNLESLEWAGQGESIARNSLAEAVLVTQSKVAVKKFCDLPGLGRFVLQDENEILAAGIIT